MEEKNIRIYRCSDDEVGVFSAIYEAGISGYGHKYIRIQPSQTDICIVWNCLQSM